MCKRCSLVSLHVACGRQLLIDAGLRNPKKRGPATKKVKKEVKKEGAPPIKKDKKEVKQEG